MERFSTFTFAMLFALVSILMNIAEPGQCETWLSQHVDSVITLRAEGRYGDAIRLTEDALAILEGDPDAPRFEVTELNVMIGTLKEIVSLPQQSLERLAEVDEKIKKGIEAIKAADYKATDELLSGIIPLQEELLGPDSPDIATVCHILAGAYRQLGKFETADSLLYRAVRIAESKFGKNHPKVAKYLVNQVEVKSSWGKLAEAEPLAHRAYEITIQHFERNTPEVGRAIYRLADVKSDQEKFIEADSLYIESGKIFKNIGEISDELGELLNNHGEMLLKMRLNSKAESLFVESIAIYKELEFPEIHFNFAALYNNLGIAQSRQGKYEKSTANYNKVIDILIKLVGEMNPYVAMTHNNIAYNYARLGQKEQAARHFKKAIEIGYATLGKTHPKVNEFLHSYGIFLYENDNFTAAESTMTEAVTVFKEACKAISDDATGRALYAAARSPYPLLALSRIRLEQPNTAWNALEADLARGLLEVMLPEAVGKWEPYSLDRVQAALEPDAALIGWLHYMKKACYVYFVPAKGDVVWKDTGFKEIDSLVSEFKASLVSRDADRKRHISLAKSIFTNRLDPLREHLDRVNRLYVIPAEEMLGIPIEALRLDNGELCADRWNISYTSSATLLAKLKERDAIGTGKTLLAVGDPPFSEKQAQDMERMAAAKRIDRAKRGELLASLRPRILAGDRSAMCELDRLYWTRDEVNEIARFFEERTVLLGRDASEQAVMAMAANGELSRFSHIHIASHAFSDNERGSRSSIVLSQVNEEGGETDAACDGRITIEEVLDTWHLNADLVTLSACRSGLGRVVRGEGFIGFSFALFKAGARSLVVSLWDVDDQATRKLMSTFYENMILHGMPKCKALREAKKYLRNMVDQSGDKPFSHDSDWAAFIIIGDA